MNIDLPGRIRNTRLPPSHALLPLFEAVINSIDAIDEMGKPKKGKIKVRIERDHTQQLLPMEDTTLHRPIRSLIVTDNGVGFTDIHYTSFRTSDTQQKARQGGKGVGRFLWLKAFDHAEIESVYVGDGNKRYRRRFKLCLTPDGVEDHSIALAGDSEIGTTVRLCDYKPEYKDEVPRSSEVLARRIVEHCLEHFVLGLAPSIQVEDSDAQDVHDLNQIFSDEISTKSKITDFSCGDRSLKIQNLQVTPKYQAGHRLHFCAHRREVHSESLTGKIPNLMGALRGENGTHFFYAGYISGEYLDETVNSERTHFAMPDQASLYGPDWNTLFVKAVEQAALSVAPYTESVKRAKEERITAFVQNEAPQYRPLLKHRKDLLDEIPPDTSDDKLDLALYKANLTYDAALREMSTSILSSLEQEPDDWASFEDKYREFLAEWNEAGIAKLARHIVHRKATLEFLKASLRVGSSGRYRLESAIHQLIFPLKKTSDEVRADQMNLWILDEKLAYHYYLASDIPFNNQEVKIPSKDRPDIIIFKGPSAFVDAPAPFSSIVLVEFKRPARDDYTDEENPISQAYEYIRRIKSGKAMDRGGRPIVITSTIPLYTYVVCDITPTLRRQAENASLVGAHDGLGYFGYNSSVGTYIEVMSFDKLVSDAERRNSALFDQLGIPRR